MNKNTSTRQIVLDTETTGLDIAQGNRIIEIGCVELINRKLTGNHYHQYINPEREVEEGAFEVHGFSYDDLKEKPLFAQIGNDFLQFIQGAELIIHNAPFDLGFLDHEFRLIDDKYQGIAKTNKITDSLALARHNHPGQRNNLDALCKRYGVDNSQRELHGALLDAQILADVYLLMTGGQTALSLGGGNEFSGDKSGDAQSIKRLPESRKPLPVIMASPDELIQHQQKLDLIQEKSGGHCLWLKNSL